MKNKETIDSMTLEEKANLTSGKDFWQSQGNEEKNIPSMFLSDGPHGIRKQMAAADHLGLNESVKATCFPTAATMASSWDLSLGEELGKALGEEAVAQKVNVLLGPGMNMKRNPRCGRNFEYFSEDPYLAGKMAASYVKGIQSNGVSACIKHFCCNNQELSRMTIDTVVDERTLREIYLTGFEIAVKEGHPKALMSSYNMVNGTHTNENMHLMRDILRNEWSYQGVVVTDWGGENDRIKGLVAGNELEMPGNNGDTVKEVIKAVQNGTLAESVLDEDVDRYISLARDTNKVFSDGKKHDFNVDAHNLVAQKCAEQSMVLLKNQGSILPLKPGTKIAIIGDFAKKPRYQGAGSSVVNPTRLENTLDSMKYFPELDFIGYEAGYDRYGKKDKKALKRALELASKADVVLLYLGLDELTEAEGLDRANLNLPENQVNCVKELAKAGNKIVAVLACGAPVKLGWADECEALLHTYLGGQAVARATLNVITGRVNPSGKLAETYPNKYHDCSSASHFPGKEKTVEYREGLYIGYRYYDTALLQVKYPFGYGLSYTKFAYSDYKIDEKGVTFKISNIGSRDGAEVAQLYVAGVNLKIFRPKKELKGFAKVFLKKGETKEVRINFDDKTFRYFNVRTNKWEIEGGIYNIMIGASVIDIKLSQTMDVKGTTEINPYDPTKLPSYYSGEAANVSDEEFTTLLGRKIPNSHYDFFKKNRIKVTYNTTVNELRYSRGWTGRFFSWAIRFAIKFLRGIGNVNLSNTLIMGVEFQPMRGISRMTGGAICWYQLDGMITMFNGHLFKGLHQMMKGKKRNKKELKDLKKSLADEKKNEKAAKPTDSNQTEKPVYPSQVHVVEKASDKKSDTNDKLAK
jgi:beta-glucosidase